MISIQKYDCATPKLHNGVIGYIEALSATSEKFVQPKHWYSGDHVNFILVTFVMNDSFFSLLKIKKC